MKFLLIKKRTLIKGILLMAVAVLAIVGVGMTGAAQVYSGVSTRKLPIYCVETQERVVAISFDACWGNEKTSGILETLQKNEVVANFFVVGLWAKNYESDLKKLSDSGIIEIGTHTNTHPHMPKLTKKKMELELTTSNSIIEGITGKKVELYRAPYGEYSDKTLEVAEGLGLKTIQWDVDSLDWKDLSANDMTVRILSKVQNGSIILMHNDGKNTLEALPAIIQGLKNKGYSFKTIGEMIYKNDYTIDHTGKQIRR